MYLKTVRIWNFRCYGSKTNNGPGIEIDFDPKLNLLIGPNDSGKTAIIDAIRYVLGTQTFDAIRFEDEDFYEENLQRANDLKIECIFSGFNETEAELEKIGEEYHEFRRQLMLDMQLGLTKTYNLFHNKQCTINNLQLAKEIKEFKSANLQIPIEEAIQRIEKLRALHKQMDEAVLKAYGWTDINLAHNFYEVDYLPENDRVRYTISPEARKEILKRLLELNHKIHAEEVAKGLWDKKRKKKGKTLENQHQLEL